MMAGYARKMTKESKDPSTSGMDKSRMLSLIHILSRIVWDVGAFRSLWADAKLCSTDAGDGMRAGKRSGIEGIRRG